MNKKYRNLMIGSAVAVLLATGVNFALNREAPEDLIIESKPMTTATPKPIQEVRIDRVVVYNDGSMTFLMDFPEDVELENNTYIEEREDEIDYIEIYEEDGTKTIIDYPLSKEDTAVKTKSKK